MDGAGSSYGADPLDQCPSRDEMSESSKMEHDLLTLDDSRANSPNTHTFSMRQQIRHLKLMEQPSPTGSTDSEAAFGLRRKIAKKVNKRNERGETPLHIAAKKGQLSACAQLIEAGADVNVCDNAGWTPLHEASMYHKYEVAELLLLNGANPNLQSIDGETPLHDAASIYNVGITWLLLQHGANRQCRNKNKLTPLEVILEAEIELEEGDLERKEATISLLETEVVPNQCPFPNLDEKHVKRISNESDVLNDNCEFNPSTSASPLAGFALVAEDSRIVFTPETSQSPDILTGVVIPGLSATEQAVLNIAEERQMATPVSEELTVTISSPLEMDCTHPLTEPLVQLASATRYLPDQSAQTAVPSGSNAPAMAVYPPNTDHPQAEPMNIGIQNITLENIQPAITIEFPAGEVPSRVVETSLSETESGGPPRDSVPVCTVAETVLDNFDESPEQQISPVQSLQETEDGRSLEVGGSNDELTNDSIAKTPPITEEATPRTQSSASNQLQLQDENEFDRLNIPDTESTRFARTAIWKMRASSQQPRYSPANSRYDFSEEGDDSRDEVRSESGYHTKARSLRGRGRQARPASGSNTPIPGDRRRAGRGRGGRGRGRGALNARYDAALNTGEDAEEGAYSPDYDVDYDRDYSSPPASKRFRLDEGEQQDSGTPTGYNSPENEEYDDSLPDDYGTRRVAPIVLRMPKKAEDESKSQSRRAIRKGHGAQTEAEDAQRMTRSKVKQTGGQLDDGDSYLRKKRGRPSQQPETSQPPPDGEATGSDVKTENTDHASLKDATHSQRVVAHSAFDAPINFRKKLTRRFMQEHGDDVANRELIEERNRNFKFSLFSDKCDYRALLEATDPPPSDSLPLELESAYHDYMDERRNALQKFATECAILESAAENDYKLCRNRQFRLAPKTSAVRALVEGSAGNPNILDEALRMAAPVEFSLFRKQWEDKLKRMSHQHAAELKAVYDMHIQYIKYVLKASGTPTELYTLRRLIPPETMSHYTSGFNNMTEYM